MDTIYDDEGRCLSTPIIIGICSPGESTGGTDPSTMREYGMYCAACKGKLFYEDEEGYELRCKSCEAIIGVRAMEDTLH